MALTESLLGQHVRNCCLRRKRPDADRSAEISLGAFQRVSGMRGSVGCADREVGAPPQVSLTSSLPHGPCGKDGDVQSKGPCGKDGHVQSKYRSQCVGVMVTSGSEPGELMGDRDGG